MQRTQRCTRHLKSSNLHGSGILSTPETDSGKHDEVGRKERLRMNRSQPVTSELLMRSKLLENGSPRKAGSATTVTTRGLGNAGSAASGPLKGIPSVPTPWTKSAAETEETKRTETLSRSVTLLEEKLAAAEEEFRLRREKEESDATAAAQALEAHKARMKTRSEVNPLLESSYVPSHEASAIGYGPGHSDYARYLNPWRSTDSNALKPLGPSPDAYKYRSKSGMGFSHKPAALGFGHKHPAWLSYTTGHGSKAIEIALSQASESTQRL